MRSTSRLAPLALATLAALGACTETAADAPRDAAAMFEEDKEEKVA